MDSEELKETKPIVFKHWAFRTLVYALVLTGFVVYRTVNIPVFSANAQVSVSIQFANLLSGVFLWGVVPLLIMSHIRKEKKDHFFILSFIGALCLFFMSFLNLFV